MDKQEQALQDAEYFAYEINETWRELACLRQETVEVERRYTDLCEAYDDVMEELNNGD